MWAFLVPYGVVAAVTSLYVFFNLYHLYAFGVAKTGTSALIGLYTIAYVVVILLSASMLATVDWSSTFDMGDIFSGSRDSLLNL